MRVEKVPGKTPMNHPAATIRMMMPKPSPKKSAIAPAPAIRLMVVVL
jgi:hypothetical protein